MPTPNPRLARAFRMLADAGLVTGLVALILAITLHATDLANALPLIGLAIIAGLIAVAAAIQRTRYAQPDNSQVSVAADR